MARWIVAATAAVVVTMAMPGVAGAAVDGSARDLHGGRAMTSGTKSEAGERPGTIAGWLLEVFSAFWDEVRSVIVPGDEAHGPESVVLETEPVGGGA